MFPLPNILNILLQLIRTSQKRLRQFHQLLLTHCAFRSYSGLSYMTPLSSTSLISLFHHLIRHLNILKKRHSMHDQKFSTHSDLIPGRPTKSCRLYFQALSSLLGYCWFQWYVLALVIMEQGCTDSFRYSGLRSHTKHHTFSLSKSCLSSRFLPPSKVSCCGTG